MNTVSRHSFLALCIVVLMGGCARTSVPDAAKINTASQVAKVNEMAKSSLGIGLVEIGVLCQSGRGTFVLADSLSPEEREAIAELEKKGYATAEYVNAAEGKFLHLALTDKGSEVRKALGVNP